MKRLMLVIYMLSMGSLCWAQAPSLGSAASFAVLGGTNVTCTAPGVIAGDVGVSPGSAVPFTNTGCTIAGGTPPGTDAAAGLARPVFLSAWGTLGVDGGHGVACNEIITGTLAGVTRPPGVYCLSSEAKTGILTLDGLTNPNGIWIFKVAAALTGNSFQVVMANGAQPCNVYWSVGNAVTLTDSQFQGTILAGDATLGSITITRGSLIGRALANVAVTLSGPTTGINILGSCALVAQGQAQGQASCTDTDNDEHHHEMDKDEHHHDKDKDGDDDKDKDHEKEKD